MRFAKRSTKSYASSSNSAGIFMLAIVMPYVSLNFTFFTFYYKGNMMSTTQ